MVEYNEIILINGDEYKYCSSCTDLLSVKKFYPVPNNKVGLSLRCKTCEIKRRRDKYEARKPVWMTTDEILTGMNYNLNDDIHLQFCLRHNLPYKVKVVE